MSDVSIDQLGPVDYLVVEFPADTSNFTGEMTKELAALVDGGIIRIIDILILTKDADGSIDVIELDDLDELGELETIGAELAEMLAEDDVINLAAAMEPGSTAGVLIWENLWAAPFAAAARRSGGQLIANGRIPIQAIIAAIEADEAIDQRRSMTCPSDQPASDEPASSEPQSRDRGGRRRRDPWTLTGRQGGRGGQRRRRPGPHRSPRPPSSRPRSPPDAGAGSDDFDGLWAERRCTSRSGWRTSSRRSRSPAWSCSPSDRSSRSPERRSS